MKSAAALAVIALVILYIVSQLLAPKPRVVPPSDVAVIFQTIKNRCPACIDTPYYYVLQTDFRSFRSTRKRDLATDEAAVHRKQVLASALASSSFAPSLAGLGPACLVVPNTSRELRALRGQLRQPQGESPMVYELTFSEACALPDSATGYYVEQVSRGSQRGSGAVYVVKKGVVVSQVSMWMN